MEEEQSGPEKQDQADEQQGATQQAGGTTTTAAAAAAVRSYECNFCKRGFTNAQALGGHMNIHRKDKAKLKQSSTSSNPDPPSTPQPQHIPPSPFFPPPPNIFHHPSTDHQKVGNWPFPSSKDNLNIDVTTSRDIMKSKSSFHDQQGKVPIPLMLGDIQVAPRRAEIQNPLPAAEPELDLELRLGHNVEPSSDQSSSTNTTKGTRKFF